MERMEQLFQSFQSTKNSGMGMGLAVSSAILREHGGRMWAENSPDGGAVFFFTLPVQRDESSNNVRVHH